MTASSRQFVPEESTGKGEISMTKTSRSDFEQQFGGSNRGNGHLLDLVYQSTDVSPASSAPIEDSGERANGEDQNALVRWL